MSDSSFGLDHIEDVQVWGLDGSLKHGWKPRQIRLELQSEVGVDAAENVAMIEVDVVVYGRRDESLDEDAEGTLLYTGSVTALVKPADGVVVADDPDVIGQLVAAAWPYLRSPLLEHAQRLGLPRLPIPLSAPISEVEPIQAA
ncbi:hypothetical protein RBS60_13080 [Sinomonas sp. ASV486]|uniref:hypothetical protein n=1 Tax=Sinomonas sp. ASV486 TaxID=3051170 RepID=UPI0027DB3715|nr:hypothetical protein [Sinomonas sp. ASV486]MDQ4491130.1 hypothetical protein [Sinomonas sp. ASV486]